MRAELASIFTRLRGILQKYAGTLSVQEDTPERYCLGASPGPATLKAWRGKTRSGTIPVAWVQVGKAYVSYHLMGIHGNTRLLNALSQALKRRMQGRTCFNFKSHDESLFEELDKLTPQAIGDFRKAGYISE